MTAATITQPRHLTIAPPAPQAPPRQIGRSPKPATPTFGRRREIAALTALLACEEIRLVTVTGPGGVGKTRLATNVAAAMSDYFADGAVFVPLSKISDSAL